jgi:hypothetical protein
MTEIDRSVRRLRRPRLTDRWPLRDQSTPLVVISWDPLQSFISGSISGHKMLMSTLGFQTLQLLLVPVNCIGWSGSGCCEPVFSQRGSFPCSRPVSESSFLFVFFPHADA